MPTNSLPTRLASVVTATSSQSLTNNIAISDLEALAQEYDARAAAIDVALRAIIVDNDNDLFAAAP